MSHLIARAMFLEFFYFLILMPLGDVNLLLGGQPGVAILLLLWDKMAGDGKPGQSRNNRNLN